MYLTKLLKKMITVLCLFAVVGMFAACSNGSGGSGSGGGDSGSGSGSSEEVKSEFRYTLKYSNQVITENLLGSDFITLKSSCSLQNGNDYKVDNDNKVISVTNSGMSKLDNYGEGITSHHGGGSIYETYTGNFHDDDYEAFFEGEEDYTEFMGFRTSYSASGTFIVKRNPGSVSPVTVAEGTFSGANPEEDCTLPVRITKEWNFTTNALETYNPPRETNIVIENGSFTYLQLTLSRP